MHGGFVPGIGGFVPKCLIPVVSGVNFHIKCPADPHQDLTRDGLDDEKAREEHPMTRKKVSDRLSSLTRRDFIKYTAGASMMLGMPGRE